MSFKSGAYFGEQFWSQVREHIPEEKRKPLAQELLKFLEDQDAEFYEGNLLADAKAGFEEDQDDE